MSGPPPEESDLADREPSEVGGEHERWLAEAEAELVVIEVLRGD